MEPGSKGSGSAWLVQIYQLSDAGVQAAVAAVLSDAGLSVDARTCERGSFLIVESQDTADALAVYVMVMMADQNAELMHSTTRPEAERAV